MFFHNFKYALKTLFRSKVLIFWTLAFPLILATFFNMAFYNINKNEKLDIIDIAIVDNDDFKNNLILKTSFENLSDENNEDRLFNTQYVDENKAKELLEKDEIVGYLKTNGNDTKIIININGINQTIFKYATEEIMQINKMFESFSQEEIQKELEMHNLNIDYNQIYQQVIEYLQNNKANLNDTSSKNLDYVLIEFYTLIAMTCLYGGILAMFSINKNLANMGSVGKRVSIAPTKKITAIISSLLASYLVQLLGLLLLFIYTIFALHINYGSNTALVILLACVGSFAGLSLGTAIGVILKSSENTKTGVLIAVTMFGCFFAGMYGITMKYIIDKNIPIINKLNPVNMITDGLYSLYYYNTYNRYWTNIISLLIFAFILIIIAFVKLRRQKYDSI